MKRFLRCVSTGTHRPATSSENEGSQQTTLTLTIRRYRRNRPHTQRRRCFSNAPGAHMSALPGTFDRVSVTSPTLSRPIDALLNYRCTPTIQSTPYAYCVVLGWFRLTFLFNLLNKQALGMHLNVTNSISLVLRINSY